jgi:heat shock protein HspQ
MRGPSFKVGDLVHHKRYDYRGVVVESTPVCEADEVWYQKNQTQPNRNQPWYHVLVHGGGNTYVAQENLEQDRDKVKIDHPHVQRIFTSFYNGQYYKESVN